MPPKEHFQTMACETCYQSALLLSGNTVWIKQSQGYRSPMKRTTKLRIIGSVILLFNLTLCGHYGIEGIALLLMTFGFAIGFEYLVVKPAIKADATKQKSIRSKFSQITTSELQSASNLTEKSGKNHEAEELLSRLFAQGCTTEAIEYLGNPILAAAHVRKYGSTMEKINKAIGTGSIKGCLIDGYLWVQDRAI